MRAVVSPDIIPSPSTIGDGNIITKSISGNPTTLQTICTTTHVQIHLDLIKICPTSNANSPVNVHWVRSEEMSEGMEREVARWRRREWAWEREKRRALERFAMWMDQPPVILNIEIIAALNVNSSASGPYNTYEYIFQGVFRVTKMSDW